MPDFAAMANVKVADIPEAKIMPKGSYIWTVDRQPDIKTASTGSTEMISFMCRCLRPIDDFEDPDELDAYGSVAGDKRTLTFFYPIVRRDDEDDAGLVKRQEAAMRRITRFLTVDLQIDDDGGKKSVKELLAESVNCQFVGEIKHEPDNRDPEVMRDRLDRTAPIV